MFILLLEFADKFVNIWVTVLTAELHPEGLERSDEPFLLFKGPFSEKKGF